MCDDPLETPGVNIKVTLHQSRPENDLHPIGFHIYKVSQTIWGSNCLIYCSVNFANTKLKLEFLSVFQSCLLIIQYIIRSILQMWYRSI